MSETQTSGITLEEAAASLLRLFDAMPKLEDATWFIPVSDGGSET